MPTLSPTSGISDTPNQGKSLDLGAPKWGLDHHDIKVLRALAECGGANAAADTLCRSIKTVQYYVTRIHKKMGTTSTLRCILLAERAGLLEGIQ
jgi:DNA-binding NarL/FixJ family response regulator